MLTYRDGGVLLFDSGLSLLKIEGIMRRSIIFLSLAFLLVGAVPIMSAEPERSRPVPEELSDAWQRFQRTLHEWGGRLWQRMGARGAGEDRPVISELLNNKNELGLSTDQVRRLEQLRDNFQRQSIRTDADLRILELDIASLLDNDPVDLAKLEAKVREEEKLRADLRLARIRAIEQGKKLLDGEQKKKFLEIERQSMAERPPSASQNPSAAERGQSSR
jgi:hypothetical protein